MEFDTDNLSTQNFSESLNNGVLDGLSESFDDNLMMGDVEESEDIVEEDPEVKTAEAAQKQPKKPRKALVGGVVDSSKLTTEKARARAWQKLEAHVQKSEAIPYKPQAVLMVSSVIQHSKFGVGVVVALKSSEKAEVLFGDQTRRLVCNKTSRRPRK